MSNTIGTVVIDIKANTAELLVGMNKASSEVSKSMKGIESVAKTAMVTLAGYFAADFATGAIKRTIDFADALSKMSQKVGVSVDSLYAMQAAGKLSDVELETLEKSLLKFNKGIGDAQLGVGNTENAFKNLGISLKDAGGHLKTSDQYLLEVADKFSVMPNGITKSTIAMQLFGKAGADMIPLMNGGAEALKQYSGVLNTETALATERFNDSMTKISLSFESSTIKMLSGMLPAMESLSSTFEEMAEWVLKNQGEIDKFTDQAGNDLTALGMVGYDAFELLADTAGDMFKTLSSVFNQMPWLVGKSSENSIENFGFFEYFILGMSTATNGIGQFVANAKMAYATVAEVHAKYGSISGLLTDGGYDAAKARMDYNSASLEAKKYTKNVADTYAALIGLKQNFKNKSSSYDDPYSPIDLVDFDKPKIGKSQKLSQAEKDAKELKDLEQRMFEDRINDGIKRFELEMANDAKLYQAMIDVRNDKEIDFNKSSVEFQSERWAEYLKNVKEDTIKMDVVFEDAFKSMENSMVDMFMTGKFEANDFFNTIIEGMIRMQIRNSITQPLISAIGGFDFGSMLSGMFASANGNAFSNGVPVHAFANGGAFTNSIVSKPTIAPMALFGEAGAEAIMPLTRIGSSLGVKATPSNVVVNVQNNSGTPVSEDNISTSFDGGAMIVNVVLDAITRNKGGMRDTIRGVR